MSDGTTPVLSDGMMRELGFTDRMPTRWYSGKRVGCHETLDITIEKTTGDYDETVVDDYFGQPAYYGYMKPEYGDPIRANVDLILETLNTAGLAIQVDHTLYGCAAVTETLNGGDEK